MMNSGALLLDTSVVIRHFRQGGATSLRLETFSELYLPSIALGELLSGAQRSARPARNLAQIAEFTAGVTVLHADDQTAAHYGHISSRLAALGIPIPQNDMWIAATAMQWGMALATTDRHFERIENLDFEMW